MAACDCGAVDLPVGVFADYRNGVEHTDTSCIPKH